MFDAAPSLDPLSLQQSAAFERALRSLGKSVLRLEDGTLVTRRQFGPLPVHMITRPAQLSPATLVAACRSLGSSGPVILAPDSPMALHQVGAVPLVSVSTVAVLNLDPDLDALKAGLHQKWRNRLKHAQTQGLRVTRQNLPDDPNNWLLQADMQQQVQRRYRSWPVALTCAFAREAQGDAKLFTAFYGREAVAGIVVLRHGPFATYHIGYSGKLGRLTSAHTLLMWHAICWCKIKGMAHLELGSLDTEDAPGLARFKLGTGARAKQLGGTWGWWPPATRFLASISRWDNSLMGNR